MSNISREKYIKALKSGREVIVTIPDSNFNSSIFFMEDNTLYAWSREIGLIKHTKTLEEIAKHFEECIKTWNAKVFICGAEED